MRIIVWSCLLSLLVPMVAHAPASSWDPVKVLTPGTPLTIEQQAPRRIRGRWEAADEATLTIRIGGQSLVVPRSSIAEVDRAISNRHFDRKRALIGFAAGTAVAELAGHSWGSELGGSGGAHTRAVNRSAVELGLVGMAIGVWKGLTKKDDHTVVYYNPRP